MTASTASLVSVAIVLRGGVGVSVGEVMAF